MYFASSVVVVLLSYLEPLFCFHVMKVVVLSLKQQTGSVQQSGLQVKAFKGAVEDVADKTDQTRLQQFRRHLKDWIACFADLALMTGTGLNSQAAPLVGVTACYAIMHRQTTFRAEGSSTNSSPLKQI